MYSGIVIPICKSTTIQEGIESQDDFVGVMALDNGEEVGVGCLVGGGVRRAPAN